MMRKINDEGRRLRQGVSLLPMKGEQRRIGPEDCKGVRLLESLEKKC